MVDAFINEKVTLINNFLRLDFNAVTGNLYGTGNGREFGDEINLITSGFDGGWT